MIPLEHFLILSALLFSIGFYGVLTRRNAVGILMSIELILNAVNINFVAFSRYTSPGALTGQVFAIFIMGLAAAGAVIGLAIVISVYRNARTVFADKISLMKW